MATERGQATPETRERRGEQALTNAIITGKLWIRANQEFETMFKLDRPPRSTLRDVE
ncbi:MAG: hypothetical protein OEM05_03345 [Myxococcales bacterium]|nr:hypothetical protein [Myxococcales bacterium]